MSNDDPKIIDINDLPDAPALNDPNRVPVTFVTEVVVVGFLNGVVNLTFGTSQYTPTQSGKIIPDMVCSSRLRMDLYCAQLLHAHLGNIIEQNTKGPAQPAPVVRVDH